MASPLVSSVALFLIAVWIYSSELYHWAHASSRRRIK